MPGVILRLEAPLLSFGGIAVDSLGVVQPFPAVSMITGLLANALGFSHREPERIQRLQDSLNIACRADVPGDRITDYQTVDLGQDHLLHDRAWTTRGRLEKRAGGSSTGTHIRNREYWADAAHTVAVEVPNVEEVAQALIQPYRPLFIGRKTCLPSAPIFLGTFVQDLEAGLKSAPVHRNSESVMSAWIPTYDIESPNTMELSDRRDWLNQIHVGQRWVRHVRWSREECGNGE